MKDLCRIYINWKNFSHNLRLLKSRAAALMPVIKANAYGHGAAGAARTLQNEGITWAAAGTIEEGATIRNAGFNGKIVILLSQLQNKSDILFCLEHRLLPLAHRMEDLRMINSAMRGAKSPLPIAFKLETGMNRLGFLIGDIEQAARYMMETGTMLPEVLVSHLAVADEPSQDSFTKQQNDIFWRAATMLRRYFPDMRCSLQNTAGLLRGWAADGELCRPGLALYGSNPLAGTDEERYGQGLLPVMEVSAPIISMHMLRRGQSVGYGRSYIADADKLIGWVALGYANGYRRADAPGKCMCLRGHRVPVIGRIAMQMTCLDLSSLPFIPDPGEHAYALGGPGDSVTAQDLALWWDTIPYEVTCLLGSYAS